jgi:hypothetical protein
MSLPGWESLESVKTIDSMVQIATLAFWCLLVIFEIVAVAWKKRATFFTVLALGALAIAVSGEIVHFKYDNRKEILYEVREAAANELIQELRKHEIPRTLTQDEKQRFVATLKTGKPHRITVRNAPDLESQNYADQLSDALREAGWTLNPPPFAMLTHSVPGIVIMVNDVKVPEHEAGLLQFAFKSIGVEANGVGAPSSVAAGEMVLWVGPKNTITSSLN